MSSYQAPPPVIGPKDTIFSIFHKDLCFVGVNEGKREDDIMVRLPNLIGVS